MRIAFLCFIFLAPIFVMGQLSEPMIPYYKNGLWGFADTTGQVKVEPIYTNVTPFDEYNRSMIEAKTNRGYGRGIINREGVVVIEPKYVYVKVLNEELCEVQKGSNKALFKNEKAITKFDYKSLNIVKDDIIKALKKPYDSEDINTTGFLRVQGDSTVMVIPHKYNMLFYEEEKDAVVGIIDRRSRQESYYFTLKGDPISKDAYEALEPKMELMTVTEPPRSKRDTDRPDSQVKKIESIKPLYDSIKETEIAGKYIVRSEDLFGLMDEDGEFIIPLENTKLTLEGNIKKYFILTKDNENIALDANSLQPLEIPSGFHLTSGMIELDGIYLFRLSSKEDRRARMVYLSTSGVQFFEIN